MSIFDKKLKEYPFSKNVARMTDMMGMMKKYIGSMRFPMHPAYDAKLLESFGPGMKVPYIFTSIKDEINAYERSAWIGTVLMNSPVYDVIGPDAAKFLSSVCINDFTKQKLDSIRHAVICNDEGYILDDGVVFRLADDHFRTYWLDPPLDYLVNTSNMDVKGVDMSGKEYFIQIDGVKSLEILEDAFQQDLHDIKFAKTRVINVGKKEVRVLRLGMSGTLAYEIHGPMKDFREIYTKVWESGKKFDARRMSFTTYSEYNHTEGGFPNINMHYAMPWQNSGDGLKEYLANRPMLGMFNLPDMPLYGSVGDDLEARFATPYDVGWGFLVNYNHDFPGKEALKKYAENVQRTPVTLEWNPEDVGKVVANNLTPGAQLTDDIAKPSDMDSVQALLEGYSYHHDWVLKDGEKVGVTAGRIISYTHNSMISIGFIRPDLAVEGNELTILWGTPGNAQFEIRATIKQYPYNSDRITSNKEYDVNTIPKRF